MALYRRGKFWNYRIKFAGLDIRESAHTTSKTLAQKAEAARRRELEEGYNRVKTPKRPLLVSVAADQWLLTKSEKSPKTKLGYEQRLVHVKRKLGRRLVTDIGPDDVLEYRRARLADGASNRTVNYEVGCIRGILKRAGFWSQIVEHLPGLKLREHDDAGRCLSPEDDRRVLAAVKTSTAPSLLALYTLSIDAGLRSAEIKALRHRDLGLDWKNGCIVSGEIRVPQSKTEAGRNRIIPLTPAARKASEIAQFTDTTPKRDRGRPWTVRADETYGRAQDYRGIFEVIWDRFWPALSKAQTMEEVVEAIKDHGRPYDQTFEPLAGLIFQVLREPTFPARPNSQKRFLADSLGACGVVSLRRSRGICAEERAKDHRKHHIIRYEYYVECSCGYEGSSRDRACRNCGATIPPSLFG